MAFSDSGDGQGTVEYALVIAVMAFIAIGVTVVVLFVRDRITGESTDIVSTVVHGAVEWTLRLVALYLIVVGLYTLRRVGLLSRKAVTRKVFVGALLAPVVAIAVPIAIWSLTPRDWLPLIGVTGPLFPWLHETLMWFPEPQIIDRSLLTSLAELNVFLGLLGQGLSPEEEDTWEKGLLDRFEEPLV